MNTRLTDALAVFLPKLTTPLTSFTAPSGHCFYPDNQEGTASFFTDPAVKEYHLINNTTDLNYVKSEIETNGIGAGQSLVDTRSGERHDWDGSTWTIVPGTLDSYFRPGRFCFSPITAKVFHRDLNGVVRQLLS